MTAQQIFDKILANQPVAGYDGVLAHRHLAMTKVVKLLRAKKPKVMIETGCQNSNLVHAQGVSTLMYGVLAQELGARMWSVDLSEANVETCRRQIQNLTDNVALVCKCSLEFLKEFGLPIDFLYLDSYDFYDGVEEESRVHCLQEIQIAWPKLSSGAVVLIDDCNVQQWFKRTLNSEDVQGKSFYAHRYLMAKGAACLLDFPSYQRMYVV